MRRFRWVVFLCVIALVVAACGRDDKESGSPETTTTTAGSDGGTASAGAFGTSDVVCQDGDPSGSPAQGVTPSEIKIATFSDPGFTGRPGLNQELFDAAQVFASWCNAAGGINGRKIVVNERDAALFDVKARMTEACLEDFMMVGGGATFDQNGVETRLSCLMPDIPAFVVSPQARGADLLVQPVPNSPKTLPTGDLKYLGKKFPNATKAYGILTGDIDTTKIVADQDEEITEDLGWKKVYDDLYPPAGVTDWTPYAQKIKESGVKGLLWVGEPENLGKLLVALNDIGYDLDFVRAPANHYDQKLVDIGGTAVKNVYIRGVFDLFENAEGDNPTQQYLDAFEEYLPSGKSTAYLGMQAWSAWMLFATAANECGDDLTRKCVYDNAKAIEEWTGAGLHAPADLTSGNAPACFTETIASPNGFELADDLNPNDGIYLCSTKNVHTIQGDYGEGVTLEDVGKTQADFK